MGFGNFYFDFRERGGDFCGQNCNHRIFCVEVTGINQSQALFFGVPESVVFHIGGDKGVAACGNHFVYPTGAGAAADGDFADRLSTIDI